MVGNRSVDMIFPVTQSSSRKGVLMRTIIGGTRLKELDPFLLLDHASIDFEGGFPDHPHRGFQTLSYILEGTILHEDFCGGKGELKAGDMQWMTAGKGMMHSETPGPNGCEGLQLWINLKQEDKTLSPSHVDVKKKDVPLAKKKGVAVSVISGESMGVKSEEYTRTPVTFLDITIEPGHSHAQLVPSSWNAFFYVLSGTVTVGDDKKEAERNYCVVFKQDGESVLLSNHGRQTARLLFLAGEPINEPIARRGPFVMNTQKEILQAIRDFAYKENGFENVKTWKSEYAKQHGL